MKKIGGYNGTLYLKGEGNPLFKVRFKLYLIIKRQYALQVLLRVSTVRELMVKQGEVAGNFLWNKEMLKKNEVLCLKNDLKQNILGRCNVDRG